jgi:hypothetical protein
VEWNESRYLVVDSILTVNLYFGAFGSFGAFLVIFGAFQIR